MEPYSCSSLKGVGPKTQQYLSDLNIRSAQDLLFHLPLRYEDRTKVTPIGQLRAGSQAVIEGKVELSGVVFRGRRQLTCRIADKTGFLTLRFFHFTLAQQKALERGVVIRCFGEVRYGHVGLEMIHPEYRRLNPEHPIPLAMHLTAIYPTAKGLSQLKWRQLIQQALFWLETQESLVELLPQTLLKEFRFPDLKEAICYLHQPPADANLKLLSEYKHLYQRRLIFEELLAHHVSLRQLRQTAKKHQAFSLMKQSDDVQSFLQALPFQLTKAQWRVIQEIEADLKQRHPMLRLVQGDVGSGKTVVAAYAAIFAIGNHAQVALMAPTELLAEQHLENFRRWLEPFDISIVWLTSQLKVRERKAALSKIKSGDAKMVIGTHALFQNDVEFNRLALMVIDEQHRFGVHQRLALREKGRQGKHHPHQLIMTATPIPRTLAMASYADLDYSAIDEMPIGRKPVKTVVLGNHRRKEVIERVHQFCLAGHQVYWVCPLIDESEVLQCEAAEKTAVQLQKALPMLKVALVHGRMKKEQREQVMQAFRKNRYHILVATTVIEVGVDVPNACLMVIENAERLGLAQLHQLRGRVGRGTKESHCILLYQQPLSNKAKERLSVLRLTHDGFQVAQKDLELRGPGEILGAKQSGLIQMKIADLVRDQMLLSDVMRAANFMLQKYPENIPQLIQRWIPHSEQYGKV